MQYNLQDEDGVYMPYKWAICEGCRGEGKRDHPAFSNGITSSEWQEWDDDDRENYMSGAYDVQCTDCRGEGKLREPDVAHCTFAQKRMLVLQRREARDSQRDSRAERWLRYAEGEWA